MCALCISAIHNSLMESPVSLNRVNLALKTLRTEGSSRLSDDYFFFMFKSSNTKRFKLSLYVYSTPFWRSSWDRSSYRSWALNAVHATKVSGFFPSVGKIFIQNCSKYIGLKTFRSNCFLGLNLRGINIEAPPALNSAMLIAITPERLVAAIEEEVCIFISIIIQPLFCNSHIFAQKHFMKADVSSLSLFLIIRQFIVQKTLLPYEVTRSLSNSSEVSKDSGFGSITSDCSRKFPLVGRIRI